MIISVSFYTSIHVSLTCASLYKKTYLVIKTSIVFFFNNSNIFFILNIYSDNYQSALKYLKNTEVNLQNVLIIASSFNIRDNI